MSPGNTAAPRENGEGAQPGRKSSSTVLIGTIGVLSLAVAGCSSPKEVTAHCVQGKEKRVVDERYCDDDDTYSSGGSYHYYYGGTVRNGRVSGGSVKRPSDARIVTKRGTVIQRGGAGGRGGSGGSGRGG
ncbi:hypothetical protein CDO52_25025 [Nocardiopsis gilva YIM 90087]|uniref:Uncharacterized protein n=1 Tax=Nocardiopsis gilva YIM 90087 TaxID=1235441 RepID=A0A223SBU6_9ACTN|nr:hypothetical protein [Nocardiopsis gilva]ASU85627.1 hypothetical protein CDO52_25025 [Nocardiopsis gilva YIM 90087]